MRLTQPVLTHKKPSKGFTLIEVMVALVVVGVALPAMLFRFQIMLDQVSRVEEKNYAMWFAQNKFNELKLKTLTTQRIEKSTKTQSDEYVEMEFFWEQQVIETESPEVFRVKIRVGKERDNWIASLDGFISV